MLAATLGGCASGPNYQDSIVDVAQAGHFSLPRGENSGAPISLWEQVLIVCPYSDVSATPAPFAKEALALDTSSNEEAHWLLFAEGSKVKRLSIDRTNIDFCQDGALNKVYESDQVWSAEKPDGAWLVTAVGPQWTG